MREPISLAHSAKLGRYSRDDSLAHVVQAMLTENIFAVLVDEHDLNEFVS